MNTTIFRQPAELHVAVGQNSIARIRKIEIRNLGGRTTGPIVMNRGGFDYRDMRRLVSSMTNGCVTDWEKAQAISRNIQRLLFASARLPATLDPLKNVAGYGGGFCLHQSYAFQIIAQAAGLRVRTCGHSFGYGHVSNEIYVDGKWRVMDVSQNISLDRSFNEISSQPGHVVRGDAYGQISSGTTSARYMRALYADKTKCYEFKTEPGSRFSKQRVVLKNGDDLSFVFPTLNPADSDNLGVGTGSVDRIIDLKSSKIVKQFSTPWPLSSVQISVPGLRDLSDFVVEISKDGLSNWIKLDRKPEAKNWAFLIDNPEKWRPFWPQSKHDVKFERYMDILRTLDDMPRFLFDWTDYTYFVRITSRRPHPAPPRFKVRTGFIFNPASMPQLRPGNNSLIYDDDGVKGARNVQLAIEWDEKQSPPMRRLPARSSIKLSDGMDVVSPPRTATGAHEDVHLTFAASYPSGNRIVYRRMESGKWSAPIYVSPIGWNAERPDIAVNDDGSALIVFEAAVQGLKGIYTVSVDRAYGLSTPHLIAARDDFRIPSISQRHGSTVISWEGLHARSGGGTRGGVEVAYIKVGANRLPIEVRGHEYINFGNPRVLVDGSGEILVTGTKGPRYIARFDKNGSPLGVGYLTTKNVMFNSRGGEFSENKDGRICVAFDARVKNTSSEIYMRCSKDDHSRWDEVRMISPNDGVNSVYPDVAIGDADHGLAAWMDEGEHVNSVFARYIGSKSSDIILLSDRHAEYPTVALGAEGDWIVWNERSNSGTEAVFGANLKH